VRVHKPEDHQSRSRGDDGRRRWLKRPILETARLDKKREYQHREDRSVERISGPPREAAHAHERQDHNRRNHALAARLPHEQDQSRGNSGRVPGNRQPAPLAGNPRERIKNVDGRWHD